MKLGWISAILNAPFDSKINFEFRRISYEQDGLVVEEKYYDNGNLLSREFIKNLQVHRPHHMGPAIQVWDRSGNIISESYYYLGRLHRPIAAGPAVLNYFGPADSREQYWIDGEKVPLFEIIKEL